MERGNEGQRWKKMSSYSFSCAQIFIYSKINTFKQLNNSNRLPQVNLMQSIHKPEWGSSSFPQKFHFGKLQRFMFRDVGIHDRRKKQQQQQKTGNNLNV